MTTVEQRTWDPARFDAERSLSEAHAEMPVDQGLRVPLAVWLLENPSSRLALPGAVDLFGHDCVHLLLGRGLLAQDEAFVLGFTMGTSPSLRPWHVRLFRACARWIYHGAYRFDAIDAEVFELGIAAARSMRPRDLATVDYRSQLHCRLVDLRRALGIRVDVLTQAYRAERWRFPRTLASQRLGSAELGQKPGSRSPGWSAESVRSKLTARCSEPSVTVAPAHSFISSLRHCATERLGQR